MGPILYFDFKEGNHLMSKNTEKKISLQICYITLVGKEIKICLPEKQIWKLYSRVGCKS